MKEDTIGVIDSGIGGLSVVLAVRELFPSNPIVYFADPLHFPYGEKEEQELSAIVRPILDFLVYGVGVRVLVVACGTVSSLLLPKLKEEYPVPLLGIVEPACREALTRVPEGAIGVLATRATVRVGSFRKTLEQLRPGVLVLEEAWPEFIEAVEEGNFDTPSWRAWVRERLEVLYSRGVRGVIMGCTHFAFISGFFEELARDLFPVINPASSCAREVAGVLAPAKAGVSPSLTVFVRGDREHFLRTVQGFRIPLPMEVLSFADARGWVAYGSL
ncbi:MAG: glutamate racemase [Candidatus Caldatribacterium sp.]|nr:glutamate racemase [Candidatus Caldatribacterium sp.]